MTDIPQSDPIKAPEQLSAKPRRRWPWLILALVVLGAVMTYVSMAEDTVDVSEAKTPPPLLLVTVEEATVGAETVEVSAFAEVRPRWSAELRAAVSGRVTSVHDTALAGERVEAGTVLITIEDSRYAADLTAAELALKEARLALWQAKNAVHVARKEFERAGTEPPNELALKLPQLGIAEAGVASAEARVAAAKRRLEEATVTAPFSGFVTERFVSPGQTVNAGDRLVKLVDKDTFELTVELGRTDWVLLKRPLTGLTARVLHQNGDVATEAAIRQGGGFLDETTRQYKVFLELREAGSGSVLSGDFVRVLLPGITVPATLNIPASALTQEGYVWHLDASDRLQRVTPRILFRRDGRIVIEAPNGADTWRIATTPLASFLPGRKVRPGRG